MRGYVILLGNPSSHGGTFSTRRAGHSSQLTASAGTGAPQKYGSVKGRLPLKPSNRVGFAAPGLMFSVTEDRGDCARTRDASLRSFLRPPPVSASSAREDGLEMSPTVTPLSGPTKENFWLISRRFYQTAHARAHACAV